MQVILSAEADEDVDRLTDWLIQRSPAAARKASEAILRGLRLLSDYPFAGAEVDQWVRELVIEFGRDGFIARYQVDGDVVTIARVFHGRQQR